MVDVELSEAAQERKQFTNFVLDWHLRKGLKTALLDVGQVVPNILCQFLADWREAELLWIFQVFVVMGVAVVVIGCCLHEPLVTHYTFPPSVSSSLM